MNAPIPQRLQRKAELATGYIAHVDGRGDGMVGLYHGPADRDLAAAGERAHAKLNAEEC